MSGINPLSVDDLYKACSEDDIAITSSAEIDVMEGVVGQDRAVQAVNFAVAMDVDGYNLFVLGPAGTGRRTFVQETLERVASTQKTASDWCYANNFEDAHNPIALELPGATGKLFAAKMQDFISEVHSALSAAFDGEDYRARYKAIESEFQEQQSKPMEEVQKFAKEHSIRIMQTPTGMVFAPIVNGEVLGPEEFEKLTEDEQKRIKADVEAVGQKMQKAMEGTPKRVRSMREKVVELDNQVTSFAVGSLVKDMISDYSALPGVVDFLQQVEQDLIKNSALILGKSNDPAAAEQTAPGSELTRRYAINVIVSREPGSSAPVVFEGRPAYSHLVGRVEQRAHMGTLTTDFTLIRGGALHRANGGYLVLDARRLLTEPYAWEGLKLALNSKCIKIESIAEAYGLTTTVALEPQPIPLKVKVALVGDRRLYYMLQAMDPEFNDLFKVAADFDDRTQRSVGSQQDFIAMMASIVKRNALLPVSRDGLCRAIEESARNAGDREKLSTEIRRTETLLRESHYWASRGEHSQITAKDIDAAIGSQEYRHGRIRERVMEDITRDNILIDTTGAKIGQVNGLAVHQIGEHSFGRPSRITARVSLGNGKVVDIERESNLGGSLHSKGVLILSGFIASNYLADKLLSLSATIAFEQSYGGVDGDSASSAELYALLSAIAQVPLKQSFAVTGSVNQYGEVQAIGGANEKIEGFFDICDQRGLTGDQGVLIPAANVKHLMLRRRVIDAVSEGQFRIFAVKHIDEGLSILTGLEPGVANSAGAYAPGTLNNLIRRALLSMAKQRSEYSRPAKTKRRS